MNTDTAAQKSDDLPDEAITIWWGAPDREVPVGADPREGIMDQASPTRADRRNLARGAKSLVEVCVRNTLIEGPSCRAFPGVGNRRLQRCKSRHALWGDPWVERSRISDEEMKRLMVEIVNRVFTYLSYPDEPAKLSASAQKWAQPRLDSNLMKTVRRRKAAVAPPKDIST